MKVTLEEYYDDFRRQLQLDAETDGNFKRSAFLEKVSEELKDMGAVNGFEHCYYYRERGTKGDIRVDGFYFNEDGTSLDLHLADFEDRVTLESLNKKGYYSAFGKCRRFFLKSKHDALYQEMDETTPEYRLARGIYDRKNHIRRVNFILSSERRLKTHSSEIEKQDLSGVRAVYSIWDISRLYRQHSSRGGREPLEVDLIKMFQRGLPCLRAHVGTNVFRTYLVFISGKVLAGLYEEFGARLLEQNVRCFLQARGNVNKGIRDTLINEPHNFFAYNNGITATARDIKLNEDKSQIIFIQDLQIVNGGQTTASLYHASQLKNAPDLSKVFVQMKISEVSDNRSMDVVHKIAKYANTQNKVTIPDLRSNHPFHVQMEKFSRHKWVPAREGEFKETKWFYERTRGQYADEQSRMTQGQKKRFKSEYPNKFTKTDLAKFENVWDEEPFWVNRGAQKNFIQYMERISEAWKDSQEQFNEKYYQRVIARAIIFKATERMVSRQTWYRKRSGYRANIVAYTLSATSALSRDRGRKLDYQKIWTDQCIHESFQEQLALIAVFVKDVLYLDKRPVQNCSEWAKKEEFWTYLKQDLPEMKQKLTKDFWTYFIPEKEVTSIT